MPGLLSAGKKAQQMQPLDTVLVAIFACCGTVSQYGYIE